jgi:hypothetical protein
VGLLVEVEVEVSVDAFAPEPAPDWLPLALPADAEEDVVVEACAPDPEPDWLPFVDDAADADVDGVEHDPLLAWSLVELPLVCKGDVVPAVGVDQ